MKRSFAAMMVSLVVVPPTIEASSCLHFETMPCSEAKRLKQMSRDCRWEEVASNDVMDEEEHGCCVDPMPGSCTCFVDGLWLPDINADCDGDPCAFGPSFGKCAKEETEIPPSATSELPSTISNTMSSSRATTWSQDSSSSAAHLHMSFGMHVCLFVVMGWIWVLV